MGLGVLVTVGVGVLVAVGTGVDVGVGVWVAVGIGVIVGVGVFVDVGVGEDVGVGVLVLVGVGVRVGSSMSRTRICEERMVVWFTVHIIRISFFPAVLNISVLLNSVPFLMVLPCAEDCH